MHKFLNNEYREVKQKEWVSYNFLTCHMAKAKHKMEWQQKKRWMSGYILISVHFSSNTSERQESTRSLLHHSSRYWNSNETHGGAVNHEGPALQYPRSWLKPKLKTTKERYNRERKHHNVRKTSRMVIPPDTDRAGLVYRIWHELQLFHSQFSFRPTQGKTSLQSRSQCGFSEHTHAMGLRKGANKSRGTVEVTLNWPLVFPLPLWEREKRHEKRVKK